MVLTRRREHYCLTELNKGKLPVGDGQYKVHCVLECTGDILCLDARQLNRISQRCDVNTVLLQTSGTGSAFPSWQLV